MRPKISIMIRAYNEERFMSSALEHTIKKLKESKSEGEILVGVQGDDNTLKIAKSFQKKFRGLRIFKREPDVIKITNFLIDKARSDIIVAADADNLFIGDVDLVVKIFKDPKVGGIVGFDLAVREWLNKGVEIFDKAYGDVKLKHHTKGNLATDPILCINIYRKSALKKPYVETLNDDAEFTHKLLSKHYKVVYEPRLRHYLMNNPVQKQITARAVFKRRMRSEKFREQAKLKLKTDRFEAKKRMSEFLEAIVLAISRMNFYEFLGFVEYLAIISAATVWGKIKIITRDEGYIKKTYPRK